jgi:hypothetical protein
MHKPEEATINARDAWIFWMPPQDELFSQSQSAGVVACPEG